MAKDGTTDDAIAALYRKCRRRVPEAECRTVLRKTPDVDKALAAMIASGRVGLKDLDPDTVSDELFGRAEIQRRKDLADKFAREHPGDKQTLDLLRRESAAMVEMLDVIGRMVRPKREKGPARSQRAPKPAALKMPPFPALTADLDEWSGKDKLPSWKGFSGGTGVELRIFWPAENEPPTPEQVAAYRHLKSNETAITKAILNAVVEEYQTLKKRGNLADDDEDLPEIESAADLKRHVSLNSVIILNHAKAGHAYVGIALDCTWDEEHGTGLLVHKSRIIDVGQADTSFDHHAARKDGGKNLKKKPRRRI